MEHQQNEVWDDSSFYNPFEASLEEGREEGFIAGLNAGYHDGKHIGRTRASELGMELGFILGCCEVAESGVSNDSTREKGRRSKLLSNITLLKQLVEDFPSADQLFSSTNEKLEEQLVSTSLQDVNDSEEQLIVDESSSVEVDVMQKLQRIRSRVSFLRRRVLPYQRRRLERAGCVTNLVLIFSFFFCDSLNFF